MQNKIKNRLEIELKTYIRHLDKTYSLSKVAPLLFRNIQNFILREGKRLRPILFVVGYLGFCKRPSRHLYKTALSIELLHDFMLVHDDIIDKSDLRRGQPSLHKALDNQLQGVKNIKFDGEDLAIVCGDVMYAMAIDTFLAIDEKMQRKEKALRRFLQAAVYTGMGEFIELLGGSKDIGQVTKTDIEKIYDYKTAYYTFACPLSCGAILAGAPEKQANMLHQYGIYLGRAFQIKDDILGLFSEEKEIGKSALTDLQEAKRTLLLWYAYHHGLKPEKSIIKRLLAKEKVNRADLSLMRKFIRTSGALDYAKSEMADLLTKAHRIVNASQIKPKYKRFLNSYSQRLLN